MSTSSNTQSLSRRVVVWLATPSGIGAMFIFGLAIRLVLAGGGGFPYDMASFAGWADRLAERGPWDFYPTGGDDFFVDYPPGYLYVLWILGLVSDALYGGAPAVFWLKLPPIFADLALAGLVMIAAERLAPSSIARRGPVRAAAAAAILLNPAIFFVSAVWGQADAVPAVLVVGSFILLGTGVPSFRREAAGVALLAVALGTKPQAGFVLPMVAIVLIWRHLRVDVDAQRDPLQRRRAQWLGASRLVTLGVVGVATGFLLFLPFQLYPQRAYEFYLKSAGQYRVTSVFAFNLWGAVGFWRPDSARFLGVPFSLWGIALFIVAGAFVLTRAWVALRNGQEQGRVLVFGSMAMTLVGFALVTRIHERYLFLPLALGAMLIGTRWIRHAFVGLSALYFINVFFPYGYYLEVEKLPAPKLWGLFDAFYGTAINGVRLRSLSAITAVACLVVAWRGWTGLEARAKPFEGDREPPPLEVTEAAPPARRWTLHLHPVGSRGALIALAVFAVALLSRVAGLGHPPGMYFDEVYHARAGAEYIGRKEVFEYTHPPLAKELIALSIRYLSGFSARTGGALPDGVAANAIAPRPGGAVWARGANGSSRIEAGRVSDACELERDTTVGTAAIRGDRITATQGAVLVAGMGAAGPGLVRLEGAVERWNVTLPARAVTVSHARERAYVLTEKGDVVTVSPEGEQSTLAIGASALSYPGGDDEVWVAFANERRIVSWDRDAAQKAVIELDGEPAAVAAAPDSDRVVVAVGDELVFYDTESHSVQSRVGGAAAALGAVPETTAVWAVDGARLRVIEPHSGVVIGRTSFARAPDALTAELTGHRLVGVADGRMQCAGGRPQFAWRLGSAITGAAMVALVFLLALRLTGSMWAGLLAALFLAADGLAFTISRIAMNDSYATAGLLGAWFCALSALRVWGRGATDPPEDAPPGSRLRAVGWLAGAGLAGGLGLASKWVALYALAGIGLLMVWDGVSRGARSIWHVAGGVVPSGAVIGTCLVVLPLALYVVSYIPYFSLGHSFGDFARMQEDMYSYHSTLTATHDYSSPWWGWPVGYRTVFLYLSHWGAERSEIWTAPNLVVFIGGLVAFALLVRRARSTRSAALLVILAAAAVQYLPWLAVSRVLFMYHYLPVVPFLAIALGWLLAEELRDQPYHRPIAIGVTAAAVVMFLWLYPILVGWEMPESYLRGIRDVLPWVIP